MDKHPWKWISPESRKGVFWAALVVTLAVMGILQVLNAPLKTAAAPSGIVAYELAGKMPKTQAILDSWDERAKIYAGVNLGFDFLFLVAYPFSIGLGCALVAGGFGAGFWGGIGMLLARLLPLAGLLDVVENYALIRLLLGAQEASLPGLAKWCAIPKFAIVIAGIVYVLGGAVVLALAKRKK